MVYFISSLFYGSLVVCLLPSSLPSSSSLSPFFYPAMTTKRVLHECRIHSYIMSSGATCAAVYSLAGRLLFCCIACNELESRNELLCGFFLVNIKTYLSTTKSHIFVYFWWKAPCSCLWWRVYSCEFLKPIPIEMRENKRINNNNK